MTTVIAALTLLVTLVVNRENLRRYFAETVQLPPTTKGTLYVLSTLLAMVVAVLALIVYDWRLGVLLERMHQP